MAVQEFDPSLLLEAASDFSRQPGVVSDASAQSFLTRFPLPLIIHSLQTKGEDYPGLEDVVVDCLGKIFRTRYGSSLIPQYMNFVLVGLGAVSQKVRCLACVAIQCLLENTNEVTALQIVRQYDAYTLLLDCLIHGDELVSAAATNAITSLAGYPDGLGIIFPASTDEATRLENEYMKCSSMGRVRVLALIQRLFSLSSTVASEIAKSNLLNLFESEVKNTDDTLVTLSVLELLYELVEVQHSAVFLSKTVLLDLLSSIISNQSAESILRSRGMMIIGRLLSNENAYAFINEPTVRSVVMAIDGRFDLLESREADEYECALESLGQIGSSFRGATLLLSSFPSTVKRIVEAAFDRQHHGKQLAALHSLANVAGEKRADNARVLNRQAEENFRRLIYDKASTTAKLTPSGLLLSVLQQDSEIRIAGYRVIAGGVARPWWLMEILAKSQIIDIVIDTYGESKKTGMEARHRCCKAIHEALASSSSRELGAEFSAVASKVEEGVRRGAYGARRQSEAHQAMVITADR